MRIGMVADGVQRTMIRPLFFYNLLCKPFSSSSSSFLARLEEWVTRNELKIVYLLL